VRSKFSAFILFCLFTLLSRNVALAQTASPLPLDTSTQGSWVGVYGQDGYLIANEPPSLPTYATVTTTAPPYTWVSPTSDVRALYTSPSKTARIASTYYSDNNPGVSSFTFNVNLTGGSHQIAIYCLDLETTARTQTVAITDTSGNVLSSKSLSSFNGGVYARWNISGNVVVKVTYTGGLNAVVSGLFFSPAVSLGPAPVVAITSPANNASNLLGSVPLSATATSTPGIASVQFQVDGSTNIPATGSGPYTASWATTSVANGSHTLTAIATDILGQSTTSSPVTVTTSNAGPPPPAATFVKTDTTTIGNWQSTYGADGYVIPNDVSLPPTYATFPTPSAPTYTWVANSTDPRSPFTTRTSTTRIASTYYSSTGFSFDINLTDGNTHQVALYLLDQEAQGRAETISIYNATNNSLLGTQPASNFGGGVYQVWNLTGHVIVTVTYTGGQNAVLSGLFFDPVPVTVPLPTVSISAPLSGASVSGSTVTVSATAAASSPATVASVQFQIDGSNLGAALTGSPYSTTWNSLNTLNGSHTLTAIVTDSLGQHKTSAGVGVTVSNPGQAAPTVTISTPSAGTVSGTVSITSTVVSSLTTTVQYQLDGTNIGSSISGSPYTYQWSTAGVSNGSHVLTALATDSLGQKGTSAGVTVNVQNAGPPAAGAVFIKTDATTQGSWGSGYGQSGFLIANDASSVTPSFLTFSTNASQYTWVPSTTDVRALTLSSSASSGRMASTYYAGSSFTFDVNLIDGNTHQVALYSVDFEGFGRTQTINILDASNNNILSTQLLSGFGNGIYKVWNLTGHVLIQVVNTNGPSAVVSGLFFGPSAVVGPPPTVSITTPAPNASLTGSATVTATTTSTPGIASVQFQVDNTNIGSVVTGSGPTFSTTWLTSSVANGSHNLTAIATDVLGQSTTSSVVVVTTTNAGPPPAAATFVKTDTATIGNWKGVYGTDGYIIPNDATVTPSYATFTPSASAATYTWFANSTDPRALFTNPSSSTRIASTYYTSSSFSFDVNLTDGNAHQVSLYLLDLDTSTRAENISITNANSNALLNSQAASSFNAGVYKVWNLTGHVIITVTYTGGQNAVVAGLFFDPVPITTPAPTVSISAPAANASVSGATVTVSATAAASSPATVASVQFLLDGANLGTAVTGSPYSTTWNTQSVLNGSHTLSATVTDSLGQKTTSAGVAVTVSNAGQPAAPTVTITSPSAGQVSGTVGLTASVVSTLTTTVQYQLDGVNLGSPLSTSPYTYQWSTTGVTSGSHILTAIATDSLGQKGTSLGVTIGIAGPAAAAATLLKTDTTTQGSWVGTYGQNGFLIANDAVAGSVPAYATVTTNGSPYTWVASTTDVRAPYTDTSKTARIASTYYSGGTFTFDVNLTDNATHQVAVYALDFEILGRNETINILDASSNVVLSTQSLSSFSNGVYKVWNLTGHVLIQVVNNGGQSGVVTGLFFGPSVTTGPPPTINITAPAANASLTGSATLSASTTSTVGIANVQFYVDGNTAGAAVTGVGPSFSTTWASNSVKNGTHSITAAATDQLGQSTTSVPVSVTVTNSGPPPASASFVKADTATIGNWKGVYGSEGYIIPSDSNAQPPYGTATAPSSVYVWNPSTTDPRGLIKALSSTDRILSTWYTSTSESFDVNLTDGLVHQMSLYCLDDDTTTRAQTITITDATLGTALATQQVTSFNGGVYEVFQISGHVTVTVKYVGGSNAVVSGLFFGGAAIPPVVSVTAPAAGTVANTVTLTANATSSVGVASVQFQVDNVNVGTAVTSTTATFTGSWNTVTTSTNGSHVVTAIATDKLGQSTTSSGVTVTVSNSGPPPTVGFTAPASGATVTGTATLTVTTGTTLAIKTVQFQANGVNIGAAVTGAGPAFSTSWNTSALTNGPYTLTAVATDYLNQTNSATRSVTVTNGPPPGITLNSPTAGASVQGSVSLSAQGTSTLGNVSVQFQIDSVNIGSASSGASPFSATGTWDTTKGTNGSHTVTAIATDVLGQTTPKTVTVTVANPAPVITALSPASFAFSASQAVSVTVTSLVGVASVQYQLDGKNLGSPVTTGPTFPFTWDTTAVANGPHTLSAVATDVLGQTSAKVSNSLTVSNATATFAKFDTATSGNWVGVYGQEGFAIANDSSNSLPAYATLLNNGSTFLYTSPDNRALQVSPPASNTNRIESVYYNPAQGSTFTLDLNLTDNTVVHRVALYFADYDSTTRSQTVSILDANSNAVLNTQTVSSFHGGVYGLWNLKGHVIVQITNTTAQSPVVSGFFFQTAPAVAITAPAAGAVSGNNLAVTATATSTVGVTSVQFQLDGTNLGAAVTGSGPTYSTFWNTTLASAGSHTLTAIATDVNGLVSTSASVAVTVANSGSLLPGATFVKIDTTTSGNWIGTYGQDGEIITNDPNDAGALPSYVTVNVTGATPYTWTDTGTDATATRGLQAIGGGVGSGGSGRDPSAWYAASFTMDVNVIDGQAHQMALYMTDFDTTSRTQTVTILNATNNAVLDTRSFSNFQPGVYAVWNITGHVTIQFTYTGPTGQSYSNAVASGLFFRSFTGLAAPVVSMTSPASGTVSGTVKLTAAASSSAGLSSVRFQLDGADLGTTLPASANGNYSEQWVTTTVSGSHSLTAIATDVNGQTTISSPVAITVSNGSAPAAAATFLTTDATTSGNWTTAYGSDGYLIANDVLNPAVYASYSLSAKPSTETESTYTYAAGGGLTGEALLTAPGSTNRIASAFFVPTSYQNNTSVLVLDLNLIDFATHRISFYFLDWKTATRNETVTIFDANNASHLLDTETISNYTLGTYLSWNITGHVVINIVENIPDAQHDPGSVAVNGIFFDPAH